MGDCLLAPIGGQCRRDARCWGTQQQRRPHAYAACCLGGSQPAAHLVALGAGLATLHTFLLPFELLQLFAAPNIVALFALDLRRYLRLKQDEDRVLVMAWIGLGLRLAAYFLYLSLDLTSRLWQRGIWFSENDVLHLGLIGWMLYLGLQAVRWIEDQHGSPDRPHPHA